MSYSRDEELKGFYAAQFGNLPPAYVVAHAPGRIELAGNHTDHQGGCVLSAAIGRRVHGLATPNHDNVIRVWMDGYGEAEVNLSDPEWQTPKEAERNHSVALIRGMAAQFVQAGGKIDGCNVVVCSDIPIGAGLSSSAAFEMMCGLVLRDLFAPGDNIWQTPAELALAGVHAEQNFFGKPCGAQDQLASVTGGIMAMDFQTFPPSIEPISFDPANCGYTVCIVDSRVDHSLYTKDFTDITDEMLLIAHALGAERLGDIAAKKFFEELPRLRAEFGDRACLRAIHYYDETRRVQRQRRALEAGDFEAFLAHVRLSGGSSAQYLQNVAPYSEGGKTQPAMVILSLCAHLLGKRGAWRIQGGGFGGGVLVFVPNEGIERFTIQMNEALGYEACIRVLIGGTPARTERVSR